MSRDRTSGIKLGPKIAKRLYMRVNIRLFHGGNISIATLAHLTMLTPDQVLAALCAAPGTKLGIENEKVVRAAATAEFGEEFTSASKARLRILNVAYNPRATIAIPQWEDAYLSFNIPFDQTITLPVSEAFKKAFDREKTLKVVKPKFDLIAKKTKDLRRLGDRLEMAIKFVRDATPLNVKELSLLEAVSAVTNEMVEEKRNDPSSLQQTANARMDTFRNQIEAFKAPAYRDLVFRPRAFLRDPKLLDDRDTFPAEVLKLFDDPELKDAVKAASKHPQLIEPKVWNEFMLALTQVAQVMCTTPPDASGRDFATEFIDKHVIPMLHEFTRHDVPGLDKILAKCTDTELKKVIESDWVKLLPKGSGDSILAIIATAASVFLAAGTNLEGPHSLAIACYSAAIPTLLERSAAKIGSGKHVSGAIWRFLARLGNFTQQERIALMEALQDKDLKALRLTIRETLVDSMLKGTAVRACAALAAVAVLAMVVSTDAELSLKRVSDLVAAGGVTVLGLAESVKALDKVVKRSGVTITLRFVALVVVVASAVSGYEQMQDSELKGDEFGYYSGIILMGSAGLTLVGWLLSLGASTAWAGPGYVLLAAGAIIGIGLAVIGLIEGLTMDGTERFIKGAMHHLARGLPGESNTLKGPIAEAAELNPPLGTTWQQLVAEADNLVYWGLPLSAANKLRDRGFSDEAVAAILDVEVHELPAR